MSKAFHGDKLPLYQQITHFSFQFGVNELFADCLSRFGRDAADGMDFHMSLRISFNMDIPVKQIFYA